MSWPEPDEEGWEEADPDRSAGQDESEWPAGVPEAGVPEAGVPEAGVPEAGSPETGWPEGEGEWPEAEARWPLDWRGLYPRERWLWFNQLWGDACQLRDRYRLALRAGWWENDVQVEVLAALSAWVARYDSGEWDDPPGKLALLFDLERVSALLRDGGDPFSPERDRPAFERHLAELGCQPPQLPNLPDDGPWSS